MTVELGGEGRGKKANGVLWSPKILKIDPGIVAVIVAGTQGNVYGVYERNIAAIRR